LTSGLDANGLLPSWNDGAAKAAIVAFLRATTDPASPDFVPEKDRIATFDQDGTTWVEHPCYAQLAFTLHRLAALAPLHPEWRDADPFKSALTEGLAAFGKFTMADLETLVTATHAGMSTDAFEGIVAEWTANARHPRWNRPYTELVYQPMLEVMSCLRANGFRIYIVTGGGQAFVRAYADRVYGTPPERIIGSSLTTQFEYDERGSVILTRPAKLLLYNDNTGKPQDIYLFLGRPPRAAFGNSTGDRQMLEYAQSGGGVRLMTLILHDDADREYAYGPGSGNADANFGTFTQELYDEATARNWVVVSMKTDWKRIFPFESLP
jgi:hypothetical protein